MKRELVNGDFTGHGDGFIRIQCGDRAKTLVLNAEDDEYVTLNQCLEIIGWKKGEPPVIVIFDDLFYGVIYRYGFTTRPRWEKYGETKGFA